MPDRAMLQEHLAQCERHVVEGDRHITRQREIVAELDRDGHDTFSARDLLRQFEEMQVLHVGHRNRLLGEIADLDR